MFGWYEFQTIRELELSIAILSILAIAMFTFVLFAAYYYYKLNQKNDKLIAAQKALIESDGVIIESLRSELSEFSFRSKSAKPAGDYPSHQPVEIIDIRYNND